MNPDSLYEDFGRKLCDARKEAGMTQEDVAKRVGLSRTSITNIEKGRQHVSLHVLYALANAIGTSPSELLPSKPSQEELEVFSQLTDSVQKVLRKMNVEDEGKDWIARILSSKQRQEEKDEKL